MNTKLVAGVLGILFFFVFAMIFMMQYSQSLSEKFPPLIDFPLCSENCPPGEMQSIKVFSGVTDEAICNNLGGLMYTLSGETLQRVCYKK